MQATRTAPLQIPGTLITIDSDSTRDIDDAIAVERLAGGGYRVVVCIADPTELVPIGSTEDANARLQGATVYVRDRAVRNMLPGHISECLASMVAGKARSSFVFEILLDATLTVTKTTVAQQCVTVSHRLSYEDVAIIIADDAHPLQQPLLTAAGLAPALIARRRRKGGMALYDLQRLLYMDEEGRLVQLARRDLVIGHLIVQELMILANVSVATFMLDNDIPGLFRNHAAKASAPDALALAETVHTWVASGNVDAASAQAKFAAILGKAEYSPRVMAHYALAEPVYAHLTSPLRRYPDLVNLRQIGAHLQGEPFPYAADDLASLAVQMNVAAQARKDERSNGFKVTVARNAERAIAQGRLHSLADHELRQAVRIEVEHSGTLSEGMATELVRRFEDSSLTDRFVDVLLAEIPHEALPVEVCEAFAAWVRQNPGRSTAVLTNAQQNGLLTVLSMSAEVCASSFAGSVTLATVGRAQRTFGAVGARKRDALQAAAVAAIHWLLQVEPTQAAGEGGTPAAAGAPVLANPKGRLLEICQQRRWPMPEFVVTGQGPANMMAFMATARVLVDGERIEREAGPAHTKKEAEAMVAAQLLANLPPPAAREADRPASPGAPPCASHEKASAVAANSSAGALVNPVGALQERAAKARCPLPVYSIDTVSLVPPLFRARVTVFGRGPGEFTAEAGTKQAAKSAAASRALAS